MDHMELPHRHGNNEELSRLEHCMQEAESFQAVAGLCRLLSDANRVRIFWLLCHCEECVVNLAALVGMSSPAASHHLRQLKDSGLVVSRPDRQGGLLPGGRTRRWRDCCTRSSSGRWRSPAPERRPCPMRPTCRRWTPTPGSTPRT